MQSKHWKRAWSATLAGLLVAGSGLHVPLCGQDSSSMLTVPPALQGDLQIESTPIQYVQFAHFAIPFDVDRSGRLPSEVNLWVSPDRGRSWLKYATNSPDKRSFEFHAAAEGEYLFAVQTRDPQGASALTAAPPMRILVDTTRPQVELNAGINSSGRLVITYRITEKHLDERSVELAYSLDGQNRWEEIRVGLLTREGDLWSGSIEIEMPRCREIELKLRARDLADNTSESGSRYHAPRTAAANSGVQLASQRAANGKTPNRGDSSAGAVSPTPTIETSSIMERPTGDQEPWERALEPTAGGVTWEPASPRQSRSRTVENTGLDTRTPAAIGHTASNPSATQSRPNLQLDLPNAAPSAQRVEELPSPVAREDLSFSSDPRSPQGQMASPALDSLVNKVNPNASGALSSNNSPSSAIPPYTPPADLSLGEPTSAESTLLAAENSRIHQEAYHSRSRTFSLDYSVEALRGVAISDIELWGTTDRGQTWERWGSDPDRESPFDVQVGDDGLFGFRMVVIGQNGMVSNRPQNGDSADMWINVDTQKPTVKITRAMYGEGAEAGMLVIDYTAMDDNLHDRPITLSFSERPNGPWAAIANGVRNTGIYLWKADPKLPEHVYLRIEAVDRAGNIEEHRLELPINLRGLTPRGRIQGFRPIDK